MLTSLQRMIGMPVILQDCRIGFVEHARIDPSLHYLEGVVVRKGLGSARWLDGSRILLAGKNCLLADGRPSRLPRMEDAPARQVYLATGEYAGMVSDVMLNGETLFSSALEISQRPSSRLMGRCMYAPGYAAGSPDGRVTAVQLLTWPQLMRHLGEEDET